MVLKNQKLRRSQRIRDKQNKNMDRISDLPESLLHHIFSFLPIESVVCTSILSKRWKYLWTTIPVLDCPEFWWTRTSCTGEQKKKAKTVINFMDRLVSPHDDLPIIRSFGLRFDDDLFDESQVNAWISTLIKRKVEELTLFINDTGAHFEFPPCLFTSETLTKLVINGYHYTEKHNLILPESISFPRLKILQLEYLTFRDEKLLSNCPVIENLSLIHCTWMGKIGNLVDQPAGIFNLPVLEELRITYCKLDVIDDLSFSAPALKGLYIRGNHDSFDDCVINIYAPILLSLVYREAVARDYVLSNFSSLVEACIDITFSEEDTYAASKLIGALSTVKHLIMFGNTFESFSLADDLITNLPTFYNLIRLEVTEDDSGYFNRQMLDFLQILPNLESLVFIATGFERDDQIDVDCYSWTLDVVPQCLLLNLTSFEFQRFLADPIDLHLVKLFLKNARVLQRMTIFYEDMENDKVEEVMDQLLLFPRGSTSCVVNILPSE